MGLEPAVISKAVALLEVKLYVASTEPLVSIGRSNMEVAIPVYGTVTDCVPSVEFRAMYPP